MSPTSPNYKKNIGRLVTDRYDFESHINGTDFIHNADQIKLEPGIDIQGSLKQNVQDAMESIASVINTPLPDATLSQKGIIRLSGDISDSNSTATDVRVSGLRGRPISTTPPQVSQVLTWNGTSWLPTFPIVFSANGDLRGDNDNQYVYQITGDTEDVNLFPSKVNIKAQLLKFDGRNYDRIITQDDGYYGPLAPNIIIQAQSAYSSSSSPNINGGYIDIRGGSRKGTGQPGGVLISVDGRDNKSIMLEAVKFSNGIKFISLFGAANKATEVNVPVTSGDMFVHINEASAYPNAAPLTGSFLFSKNGRLWIKEGTNSDNMLGPGISFPIGELPEIIMWGNNNYGTKSYKFSGISDALIPEKIGSIDFSQMNNSSIKVDAVCTAIDTDVNSIFSYQVNMSMGYVVDSSGQLNAISGTITYADERTNLLGPYDIPYINDSQNILEIITGASESITLKWNIVLQITYVKV